MSTRTYIGHTTYRHIYDNTDGVADNRILKFIDYNLHVMGRVQSLVRTLNANLVHRAVRISVENRNRMTRIW